MKVILNDTEFVIQFNYNMYRVEDGDSQRVTTASLHEIQPDGEVSKTAVYTTKAVCSNKDNFCKSTGRKIAFARMVKWLSQGIFCISKEKRRELWVDYFREHSLYIFLNMKEVKDGEKVS